MQYWTFQLFLLGVTLVCAGLGNVDHDFFSTPNMCTETAECTHLHRFAVCADYEDSVTLDPDDQLLPVTRDNVTTTSDDGSGDDVTDMTTDMTTSMTSSASIFESTTNLLEMRRCRCNADEGFHKEGSDCVKHVLVDELCSLDAYSRCTDSNAECVSDGSQGTRHRCQCKHDYIKVYHDGQHVCARKLTVVDDTSCEQCDENEGTCYDVTDDGLRDGCRCQRTKSGENCTIQHVSVNCNVDNFKMVVCYNRHTDIDFSEGLILQVTGRDDDSKCRGHDVKPGDTECPGWESKLVLDLHTPLRWRCGTEEITSIPRRRRFQTSITAASLGPVIDSSNSVTFNAFCEFQTSAETSFNGQNVKAVPGNDRGQHKEPGLTLQVQNHLGMAIPEGVALRLGDKIRFKIDLKDDGIYNGLRVEQCAASSSPVIPDPKAATLPLISNGCPAARQSVINDQNTWRPEATGVTNVVETGYVNVFKLSKGSSVFLHCRVKVCLSGIDDDCEAVMCTSPRGHLGYGRKRRATEDETTSSLTRELRWYQDELMSAEAQQQYQADRGAAPSGSVVVMEAAGFGVLLTLLLVLLLTFMVISALLLYRLRRGNFTNPPEEGYAKPQHFALPRITRNTFRI